MDNIQKLNLNDSVLELFEEYLSTITDVNQFVENISFLGIYLANSPCRRLYSSKLEERVKYFQHRLIEIPSHKLTGKTLHVASQIYLTGGHTRVIENWINFFENEIHDIVLTDQYRKFDIKIPSQDKIILLNDEFNSSQKISILHDLYSKYDKVIFHIHQHDVIPLISMGWHKKDKFFFYNHADHTFGIGTSVVDEVYDMSEQGQDFSLNFRGAISSKIIPFPLDIDLSKLRFESKEYARKELGISPNSKIILSVGTPYKFIPNEKFNLFEKFESIAAKNPDFHFYFIGPDESFRKFLSTTSTNIHLLGLVKKQTVLDYYQVSDIYIDSLPINGGLALIEGILSGLPIITFESGFNTFDAAIKFKQDYQSIDSIIVSLLQNQDKLKELQKSCLEEAKKHQKLFWKKNFDLKPKNRSQMNVLKAEKLKNYCEMLASKYEEFQIPRVRYNLSNTMILKLMTVFPIKFIIKIVLFQFTFPIIKPYLHLLLDKKVRRS